jgi:hypothetical protein
MKDMHLSYADLVARLTDLERLAEPPLPGERGGCQSRYDRRSRFNAETGSYEEWDANDDGSGYIRREGDWIVAFEADGPGVIWRVWSALPGTGHIQIFVDNAERPVVDMPFRDFFERWGDEIPPLNLPSLAPTLSRGRNRFIPIPYNRWCKVRLGPGWGAYYHFTYTTFPACPDGVALPSFGSMFDSPGAIARATAERARARRGWRPPRTPGDALERVTLSVAPGQTATIAELRGNRAICAIRVAPELPEPPADRQVLRELALSITWDGDSAPSVWSPLGDFFGSAPGLNEHRALPQGATAGGLYSHWFMPFAERALLQISNDGQQARTLTFTIVHRELERPADELLRFHAKWHRDGLWEHTRAEGRAIDWPMLLTRGQGRFCGVHLHVYNRWAEPAARPESWWYGRWDRKTIDWWWGEGDEKFFVDGERFPSTFGTGSEDYVGYAWAAEPPFPTFESAYACQPSIELNANGHTSVSRFHICDDVPFQESFEASIERYKASRWGDGNDSLYAVVAYWYQRPGGGDPYGPAPLAERLMGL